MQHETKLKVKVLVIALLTLYAVLLVIYNSEPATVNLIVFKISNISLVVLLFATLAVGFVIGIVVGGILAGEKPRP